MKRKRKTPEPSSFSPDLHALLLAGSKKRITVNVESEAKATRLRFRLHELRKSMREYQHHAISLVESVQCRVEANDEKEIYRCIIEPADENFADAIRAAGVDVDAELGTTGTQEGTSKEGAKKEKPATQEDISDFFKMLGGPEENKS